MTPQHLIDYIELYEKEVKGFNTLIKESTSQFKDVEISWAQTYCNIAARQLLEHQSGV